MLQDRQNAGPLSPHTQVLSLAFMLWDSDGRPGKMREREYLTRAAQLLGVQEPLARECSSMPLRRN